MWKYSGSACCLPPLPVSLALWTRVRRWAAALTRSSEANHWIRKLKWQKRSKTFPKGKSNQWWTQSIFWYQSSYPALGKKTNNQIFQNVKLFLLNVETNIPSYLKASLKWKSLGDFDIRIVRMKGGICGGFGMTHWHHCWCTTPGQLHLICQCVKTAMLLSVCVWRAHAGLFLGFSVSKLRHTV